jgi:MYXO-CTERM domain-containing protein
MGTGYFKVFSSETNHFWCCTGTGMENFTRLNDSVYFHDAKDVWLTYYVSSTLNWKERGLAITQTTDLPLSNKVNLTISQAPLDAVNIRLRKPYWTSTCQIGVTVNGQSVAAQESGGFISISRVWQPNDKVELTFPLFVQTSRLQDNQNAVAFTYGPLVLSAGLGTASMTTASHGVQVLKATKPSGLQETIAINSGTTINQWLADINKNLVQTPGKLEFNLKNTDSDGKLVFIPHYSRYKDRYGIYFKLSGTQGSAATTNIVCPPITGGSDGTGGTGGSGGATAAGGSGGATNSSGGKTGNANGGSGASSSTSGGTATVGSGGANGGGSTGTTTAGSGGIASASGGTTGIAGGSSNGGATAPTGTKDSTSDSGCSCVVAGAGSRSNFNAVLLAGFGVGLVARRRRSRRA